MTNEISELKEEFQQNGFAVARGLFSPEEIATIRETFMQQAANGPVEGLSDGHHQHCSPNDPLAFYPRMMHPHRHTDKLVGPLSMQYMLDGRVHDVLSEIMGDEPVAAQSMFYFKPPGARGQDLHQDNFYLRVAPDTCYAAWTAAGNGAPQSGRCAVLQWQRDSRLVSEHKHRPLPSCVHLPLSAAYQHRNLKALRDADLRRRTDLFRGSDRGRPLRNPVRDQRAALRNGFF
jgi:phytanoyl-CoA hydroxylase